MARLSDEEITEVFNIIDEDGTGTLSYAELDKALKLLRIDLTSDRYKEIFGDDLQSTLEENTFRELIRANFSAQDSQQECHDCLKEFDTDNDGKLNKEELKSILTTMGSEPLDDDAVEDLITEFDINGDGLIDISELVKILYRPIADAEQNEET